MRSEFPTAGFDGAELVELFLQAVWVAPCELFVASGLGFCFAWRGMLVFAEGEGDGKWEVPFFIAFAFSALRWACAGLTLFSLGMVEFCDCEGMVWELGLRWFGVVLRFENSGRILTGIVHRPASWFASTPPTCNYIPRKTFLSMSSTKT